MTTESLLPDPAEVKRTLFSVGDFLSWQRQGTLELNPKFQRRSVWKPGAKSYLVDTVVRNLPTPLIFLRETFDLRTLENHREVIDGQQRLRTLIAYVDSGALPDFEFERDGFVMRREHNEELAGKRFKQLDAGAQTRILSYQFSTHVLPTTTEDRDVLSIFARLNSTGTPLNYQELRNAKYFGAFKSLMYELAYQQLERWLGWGIFRYDDISRMLEVEMTSDLIINMMEGLSGKSQTKLDKTYQRFDEVLPNRDEVRARFGLTMDQIDDVYGNEMRGSVFGGQVYFFSLFVLVYDLMWGLGTALADRTPSRLPGRLTTVLTDASRRFRTADVPDNVLDAVQRASADYGRRKTRHTYLKKLLASAGLDGNRG